MLLPEVLLLVRLGMTISRKILNFQEIMRIIFSVFRMPALMGAWISSWLSLIPPPLTVAVWPLLNFFMSFFYLMFCAYSVAGFRLPLFFFGCCFIGKLFLGHFH